VLVRAAMMIALLAAPGLAAADPELDRARALLLTGHYAEAGAAYERLAARAPVDAAIGAARARSAVGRIDEALRGLSALADRPPAAAILQAELARLEFERGRYDAAQARVDAALHADPDQPLGRWVLAELHRVAGRLDEANEAYLWFIHFYNDHGDSLTDPDALRWTGLAAAQYARWNHNSGQFSFLVNTLYPEIAKRDSLYWPAHLEAARLFLEKYNTRDANDELRAAEAINPNAVEVLAARATIALQQFNLDAARAALDRALAINPRHVPALLLRADVTMVASGPRAALPILEQARALNPVDEETLGRIAAVHGAIDGMRDTTGTPMAAVIAAAVQRNPHAGALFASLAAALDRMQRYPYAARWYDEARRRMPQLIGVPGELGLLALQLGDEPRGRDILKEAFEADPFNARVKNSLEVLDLLDHYGTLTTDHFVVRFDRDRDSLLARYAARWLEDSVFTEVTRTFRFAPPGRTLIELFSSHDGTSGHGWFSSRLTGLPFIGTVGGCPGTMVAITSPGERGVSFNWARVLKHEFVHVVNLQQTDFTIPRWYTEGLAVANEGPGTPRQWDPVLARRVAADSLFDLDTIQMGFVRPSSGDDWTLAYYQALLYTRYLTHAYGSDATARLIGAYADHLDTRAALQRCFGVDPQGLQRGYVAWVKGFAGAAAPPDAARQRPEDADRLEQQARATPGDAHVAARLAMAQLQRGRIPEARAQAERALALDPHAQLAAAVLAQVHVAAGEKMQAIEVLRAAFDPDHPELNTLALYANLLVDTKAWAEVERLARIGLQTFPGSANWQAALIAAYRGADRRDSLAAALARAAEGDPDDAAVRMELAGLATAGGDPARAAHWALDVIHIDVTNAEAHAIVARGLAAGGRHAPAVDEYDTACTLAPDKPEWRLAEAAECVAAGLKTRARELLAGVLRRDPGNAEARRQLTALGK
jgi:tetratricopeptide (TPR) repeat protein